MLDCPRSSAVPRVLGVFVVDPKDAKAPDPKPKAEDAPDVGEATAVVLSEVMPLAALALPPKAPSPPNFLDAEYVRVASGLLLSFELLLELAVDKDSLLELCDDKNQL